MMIIILMKMILKLFFMSAFCNKQTFVITLGVINLKNVKHLQKMHGIQQDGRIGAC